MGRVVALLYGAVSYLFFLGTFLYAIWFLWTLDRSVPPPESLARSLLINTGLLALFALQHSVMARRGFKRVWMRLVPPALERSTYVVASSAVLLLLIRNWQPLPSLIWEVEEPTGRMVLQGIFWLGWAIVLISTFLIDHFDLFGLKQVWYYWRGRSLEPVPFKTPVFYRLVRHPLYFGFLLAFWATPRMTASHLFFAVMTTAYILVAIQLEERDLVRAYGDTYRTYQRGVSMLIPWAGKRKSP